MKKKPELLIPAGSPEVFKTAVRFGADAVYIGGEAFSLRAKAKNFSLEEMRECIGFAHSHGVKVYVTANILAHNGDLEEAARYFQKLGEMRPERPDALILSDPGMYMLAKEICPQIERHISTQANNTNYLTYRFWWEQGAKRVVSARELSLQEIGEIRKQIPPEMEIESFVHGAMCISYSGRCLLSNYFTGRDANQGACTHPCRWKYAIMEETRPGEYLPVYENERGTYIFNSGDLCMIEHIPEMIESGIDSFKVEGRMKTALYVAAVTRTYRRAIDDYFESESKYRENMDWYRAEIAKCTYRRFNTGFYFGKPDEKAQIYEESTYVSEYIYLGIAEEARELKAESGEEMPCRTQVLIGQKNKFCVGDTVEIVKHSGENVEAVVEAMRTEEGEAVESAPHPGQKLWVTLSGRADRYDLLRMKAPGDPCGNCIGK